MKKKKKKGKVVLFDIDKMYQKYYATKAKKSKSVIEYGKLPKIDGRKITDEDVINFSPEGDGLDDLI